VKSNPPALIIGWSDDMVHHNDQFFLGWWACLFSL
jgi:hypothetical protein